MNGVGFEGGDVTLGIFLAPIQTGVAYVCAQIDYVPNIGQRDRRLVITAPKHLPGDVIVRSGEWPHPQAQSGCQLQIDRAFSAEQSPYGVTRSTNWRQNISEMGRLSGHELLVLPSMLQEMADAQLFRHFRHVEV
jgi:hypothetical protein